MIIGLTKGIICKNLRWRWDNKNKFLFELLTLITLWLVSKHNQIFIFYFWYIRMDSSLIWILSQKCKEKERFWKRNKKKWIWRHFKWQEFGMAKNGISFQFCAIKLKFAIVHYKLQEQNFQNEQNSIDIAVFNLSNKAITTNKETTIWWYLCNRNVHNRQLFL